MGSVDINDKYKIPLAELLCKGKPLNYEKMRDLLDNNGYFDRYKIHLKEGKQDFLFWIEIQLKNEKKVWYKWPYKSYFDANTGRLQGSFNLELIEDEIAIYKTLKAILETGYTYWGVLFPRIKIHISFIKKYIQMFQEIGIIYGDEIFIEKGDFNEVYENIINKRISFFLSKQL